MGQQNYFYLGKLNIKNIQEKYAIHHTTREAGEAEALYQIRTEEYVMNQNRFSKVPCDLYVP